MGWSGRGGRGAAEVEEALLQSGVVSAPAGWSTGWREKRFVEMSEAEVEQWFSESILFYCSDDGEAQ